MATNDELHTVIAKAAASKTFRDKLAADPNAAATSIGVHLDQNQLASFKNASQKIKDSSLDLNVSKKVASLLAVWI